MLKFITPLLPFVLNYSYTVSTQDTSVVKTKDPAGKVKIKRALIRGRYLQVATSNSMVVRWRTDSFARSRVPYGTTFEKLAINADDSQLANQHILKLTSLAPNTGSTRYLCVPNLII